MFDDDFLLNMDLEAIPLMKRLQKDGEKLRHISDSTRTVTLPMHNKDLARGTLMSILRQAKITLYGLLRLLGRR